MISDTYELCRKTPIDKVVRIEIELTSICNLKCPLCMRQTHPELKKSKVKYRPLEEIIKQLDGYPNVKFITIAGPISEPTTYPHLFELIEYLNKREIEISLFINGSIHDDSYYRKLGVVFQKSIGHVYFTIAGSTQELHEKYRVGSKLEDVLRRLEIFKRFSLGKECLTWIVFNYNEKDFLENNHKFKEKYMTEYFYSIPFQEHFNLDIDIHMPEPFHSLYKENIDINERPKRCKAVDYGFALIDHAGKVFPCSLYKTYGETHCYDCSENNHEFMKKYQIHQLSESETSETDEALRL